MEQPNTATAVVEAEGMVNKEAVSISFNYFI